MCMPFLYLENLHLDCIYNIVDTRMFLKCAHTDILQFQICTFRLTFGLIDVYSKTICIVHGEVSLQLSF